MNYKENNEGQSKLEAVLPDLKILMDACGQKVSIKKVYFQQLQCDKYN
jgi:hypothetical protein